MTLPQFYLRILAFDFDFTINIESLKVEFKLIKKTEYANELESVQAITNLGRGKKKK